MGDCVVRVSQVIIVVAAIVVWGLFMGIVVLLGW